MRDIGNCAAQELAGHTDEVNSLPTTETVLEDGTHFNAACGSTFLDVDTGDIYMFFDGTWKKL